jgi:hypothetical protein
MIIEIGQVLVPDSQMWRTVAGHIAHAMANKA